MRSYAIAIIQARMSSTRLPGKVLKPLSGKPMIWHIVQRARICQLVDRVVVATSVESSDDPLAMYCTQSGIECFRGSLSNVLSRYLDVLDQHPYPYFVRITGDCPLIDPGFIDCQIQALMVYDADMIRINAPSTLLEGQGVHSSRSLRWVSDHSDSADDLEHVGSRTFAERADAFRIVGLKIPSLFQNTRWRLTVDELMDYQMIEKIYDALYDGNPIPLQTVIRYLEEHSEVAILNKSIQHSKINQALAAQRAANQPDLVGSFNW